MRNDDKIKVLYIAGSGRSGSTILNAILGQVDGFFAGSEIRGVWDCGVLENRNCGCGERFWHCDVWRPVFQTAFGGMEGVDASQMVYYRESLAQTKFLPGMMRRRDAGPQWTPGMQEFMGHLAKLYRGIQTTTGCRVIVDASKWPSYGYLLQALPTIDLHVLHFVRDPRAVAFSWMRQKESAPGRWFPRYSPWRTAVYWLMWELSTDYLWRRPGQKFQLLRYEDFVAHPRQTVQQVVQFMGEEMGERPFLDERTVSLAPTHGVAGNPTRFLTGTVTVKADDEWASRMSGRSQRLVTAVTRPWLRRYGYAA